MSLALADRVHLAQLPTPLHKLERLSREWGVDLWIKRDDLTGSALSGNKIRKLEFELAEALRTGCKAVVTCGGVQSNHARATAIAARRLGLVPHLVLRTDDGTPPAELDGNTLLDRIVGAEITWVSRPQYSNERAAIMADIAEEMRGRGLPAMVIPEGASDARGSMGYVSFIPELQAQAGAAGLSRIDYLVHACGSGGTSAGLAIGNEIFAADMLPVAFAVCDDEKYFRDVTAKIFDEFAEKFAGIAAGARPRLLINDQYKGIGYAKSTREELDFIRKVAETEGILLDPVYSAKAFFGMAQEIAKRKTFRAGSTICFVHTGGIFGLFPKKHEFGF
ncbi:MAG TPA: D-cysteine desulfhydrase family protein [bacterium]|nr:D-cysteine desulfhydrase family protein [bacterium]